MFNLSNTLKEINITPEKFINSLDISMSSFEEIINSGNSELQFQIYERFVKIRIDKEVLQELNEYFGQYIENKEEMAAFFTTLISHKESSIPRKMILTVKNLMNLADDIEKIRLSYDALKIFFYVTCIESITILAYPEKECTYSKTQMVIDFFEQSISDTDKQFILNNVKRSLADDLFDCCKRDKESDEEYFIRLENNRKYTQGPFNQEISIQIFARIISEVRNIFAHQGIYWGFSFADSEYPLMNDIELMEQYCKKGKKEERVYDINLSYSDFRRICIRGFLYYIRIYFESKCRYSA